jgi:D-alanyl-D-alanine carboxypeptidase
VPGTLPSAAAGEIPTAPDAPAVNATAYAVYDSTKGRWLAGNQADAPLPVGSVMKLLTSYVVMQAGDPTKVVTVPKLEVDISESSIGLYEGEQLPRDVLFRAMIIVSANDAARTLALDIGGTTEGFVAMMNNAAAQLGLTNTVAANPIGLDAPGAHSSARDVIDVAAQLMQDQTIRESVAKPTAKLHGQVFSSTNRLLTTYDGADGIKTGHTTDAGYCLVGSATRDGRRIIVAVLGAPSEDQRFADAAALLDWGFAQP